MCLAATLTLADLKRVGQARVVAVDGDDDTARRLLVLGFAPGTPVRFTRQAPFAGPLVVEVRGAQICLRLTEARRIRIAEAQV